MAVFIDWCEVVGAKSLVVSRWGEVVGVKPLVFKSLV